MMSILAGWRVIRRPGISVQEERINSARLFRSLALGALWLIGGLLPPHSQAKEEQYLLRQSTYEALSAAQELMDKQKYVAALKKLRELQEQVQGEDKPYEQAVILQILGYLYSATEAYPKAIEAAQKSLSLDALPAEVSQDLHYMLAQLYMITEHYAKGIEFLETWFDKAKAPPAEAYVLLANAYYQLERYREVIPPIVTAIDLAKDPPEAWYQLQLAANLELKRYPQAARVLATLINLFPQKEQHWKQLAAVYMQLDEKRRALAVQALSDLMGHLEGKGLIYLSNLYRYLHIPYKAAQILQQALDAGAIEATTQNWKRTAYAWSAAREWKNAMEAFSEAGKLNQTGEFDLYRAQLLIRHLRWEEAIAALRQALRKGGLDNAGQVRFLLGQVHYEQGRLADAISALERIQRSSEYGEQASRWLKHLKAIQQRNASG